MLAGAIAVVSASLVNVVVRVVATALLGVPAGYQPLGWVPIVVTTTVGVVGATVVYGLVTRVSKRPTRTFLGVAGVALLLSFGPILAPPAFLADTPTSVMATLAVMHLTTAVVAVAILLGANERGGSP